MVRSVFAIENACTPFDLPFSSFQQLSGRCTSSNCRQPEQPLACYKQVHQGAGGKQAIGVLLQSSVAHFHKSELQLHDPKHVPDPAAHPRLDPVLRPLDFIDMVFIAATPLGAVARSRCMLMDDLLLPLIGAVPPRPGFLLRAVNPAAPPNRPRWPASLPPSG